MRSIRTGLVLTAIMALGAGCASGASNSAIGPATAVTTSSGGTTSGTTAGTPGGTTSGTTGGTTGTSEPPETAGPTTPATEATIAVVDVQITGTAVSGNSGGVGEQSTDTLSEAVRNEDGTCSGWKGPGDAGAWTQGLAVGAPVQFIDRGTGDSIGTGRVTASSFQNVATDGSEQWICNFDFTGTIASSSDVVPDSFKVKIADLSPWLAVSDPTHPGSFVASVDTKIEVSRISDCADRQAGQTIFDWSSVGQFWANGFRSLCSNGLIIDDVKRPCRPANVGSEYIIDVRRADDPSVVLEDADGLKVNVDTLAPDTKVIVDVATGRPC